MYTHLLVALDGSEAAEQVLPHAEVLADTFKAQVTLLRACISTEAVLTQAGAAGSPDADDALAIMDPTPIMDADRQAAAEYLASIEPRLTQRGIAVTSEYPEGNAQDVIVDRAKALGADLIVMTTHGRSGLGRIVFGSVADSVIRHAHCPVLLVRVTE